MLEAGGALAAAAVAGCLGGGGGDAPDPVALSGGLQCDVCAMVIEKHPGPNGQIFYPDREPGGHENPARFDSLKQCLFPFLWEHQQLDWRAAAVYVTDYSAVDYTVNEAGGNAFMSAYTDPASFARAQDLYYAVESGVQGAMGGDFMPFSERADADAFVAEWGGSVVAYGDIDETLVGT